MGKQPRGKEELIQGLNSVIWRLGGAPQTECTCRRYWCQAYRARSRSGMATGSRHLRAQMESQWRQLRPLLRLPAGAAAEAHPGGLGQLLNSVLQGA